MSSQAHPTINDDAAALRSAMRQLAGGVSVLTLGAVPHRTGFTATSVSSLSMHPPRLIACLNKASSSFTTIRVGAGIGVNVLSADHRAIADRFSGRGGVRGEARFDGAKWSAGEGGGWLLDGALAAVDGVVEELIERHSHVIVVIRPLASRVNDGEAALLYWRGVYDSLCAVPLPQTLAAVA